MEFCIPFYHAKALKSGVHFTQQLQTGCIQASKKATILGSKGLGIPPLPLLVAPPSAARNEDGGGANTTALELSGQLGKDATPCDVKMFRPLPPLHPLLDSAKVPVGCALGSLGATTKGGAGRCRGTAGGGGGDPHACVRRALTNPARRPSNRVPSQCLARISSLSGSSDANSRFWLFTVHSSSFSFPLLPSTG